MGFEGHFQQIMRQCVRTEHPIDIFCYIQTLSLLVRKGIYYPDPWSSVYRINSDVSVSRKGSESDSKHSFCYAFLENLNLSLHKARMR